MSIQHYGEDLSRDAAIDLIIGNLHRNARSIIADALRVAPDDLLHELMNTRCLDPEAILVRIADHTAALAFG